MALGGLSPLGTRTACQPFAGNSKNLQLHLQVLSANRDHVHHVEATGGENLLEDDGASRRTSASATRYADADRALSRNALLACLVPCDPTEAVQEGPETLAQVAEVHGRGEHSGIALPDLLHDVSEVVLDDAASLGPTRPSASLIALSAPLDILGGEEKHLAIGSCGGKTFQKGLGGPGSLAVRIPTSGNDHRSHQLSPVNLIGRGFAGQCSS